MDKEISGLIAFYDDLADRALDAAKQCGRSRDGYRRAREARIKAGCFAMVASDLRKLREARDD